MSWFSIFDAEVIFGGLRLCNTSLDWGFSCNIGGPSSGPTYCSTFPDSTCNFGPSAVFSSFQCVSNTTTTVDFSNACPGNEKYYMNYEFRQSNFTDGPAVNVSIVATFNCEEVVMEHNGTGLFVTVQDNTSQSGCPGFVTSTASTVSTSISSASFSNSIVSPPTTLTSTLFTTETYTVTSCPPTVTNCSVGSLTTRLVTSYTTYCPTTVSATTTPPFSSPGFSASQISNATTSYGSSQTNTASVIPTSSPSVVQVSSGSSLHVPRTILWILSAIPALLFISSFMGVFLSSENNLNQRELNSSPSVVKRIPITDISDIKSFGSTLVATMESNLPTISGKSPSLLQSKIDQVTNTICQAGTQNRNLYGPNWTTTPELKLLGHMLADCATSMDQMDQDLLMFYTQEEIDAGPEGVLFLKFAGIMYCNRLIAPLANDPASLDGICTLVA